MVIVLGIVFASGISYRWIVGTLAVVIPMIATGVYLLLHGMIPFIKEYQAGRILAWFYPEQYGEARYQQNNSIIAIGSGQLHGKGLYNTTIASVKNGNFLSEEQTDFIFAVIGEELGFIGCAIVILLFLLIVYECLMTVSYTHLDVYKRQHLYHEAYGVPEIREHYRSHQCKPGDHDRDP